MQTWTLPKIKKALKEISQRGWIKSNRLHDTGIGKTLEDLMGLTENNIALPDFGVMELKSQRINTISMLTLFTKSPDGITNGELRKRFGYPDPGFPKIKILHQTIDDGKKNGMGFHCKIDKKKNKLFIMKNNETVGYYGLDFLRKKAAEKIGNGVILVLAETKKGEDGEYFHYKEAYILKNIDPKKFLTYSKYDIRLGIYRSGAKAGQPHDHGSAFRIAKKGLPNIFQLREKIL
jgi:hypothetical protein